METSTYYERHLKFCPECGKELERNPISFRWSCFLHGDFAIHDGSFLVWVYTEIIVKRD